MHAQEHIGDLRLDLIKRSEIRKFIEPLFSTHSELAGNLLGAINAVLEPSPMPPILEDLAASIEADDRAWLEANRAKCEEASFAFDPAIKRIEMSDYGFEA